MRVEETHDDVNMQLIDLEDKESRSLVPSPASADPSQPLSALPAIDAALAEILSGALASRTRRNKRRPTGSPDPVAKLKEMVKARRQVEATRKAEADEAAAIGQLPQDRLSKRDRLVFGSLPIT